MVHRGRKHTLPGGTGRSLRQFRSHRNESARKNDQGRVAQVGNHKEKRNDSTGQKLGWSQPMNANGYIGIDFGTTNSHFAYAMIEDGTPRAESINLCGRQSNATCVLWRKPAETEEHI